MNDTPIELTRSHEIGSRSRPVRQSSPFRLALRSPVKASRKKASSNRPPTLVDPQPIVKVHVKSKDGRKETYKIHKNFICYYSPFFDAAFNGSFAEGESQEMDLEDVDIAVFGIFVNWLYTQDVMLSDSTLPDCKALMSIWILADRVLAPKLQNYIIRRLDIQRVAQKRIPASTLTYVYENTNENSPLRLYIVDTRDYVPIQNPESYPHEFLVQLVNAFALELRKGVQEPRARYKRHKYVGLLEDHELIKYYVDESPGEPKGVAVDLGGSPIVQPKMAVSHCKKRRRSELDSVFNLHVEHRRPTARWQ